MLPFSFWIVFVPNLSIFEMVVEMLLRFLSFYDVTAGGNQSVDKLRVIFFYFPVTELLKTLMLMNHSFGFLYLWVALSECSARE